MTRRLVRSLLVLSAFVGAAGVASAQLAWTELRPAKSPAARYDHAMKRMHPSFQVLLFGGRDATQTFADTWVWTGSNWQLRASSGPPARSEHALADYHFEDDSIVMFGGRAADGSVLGDTWIWNGTAWSQVATAVAPSARRGHAMAKDEYALKTAYLFGGRTATGLSNELWRFVDGQWSPVPTNAGPSAREGHAFVRSADATRFLVIGGKDDSGPLADVWEFDGTQWSQVDPLPLPIADAAVVTEDLWRSRPLVFGGADDASTRERLADGEWIEHATVHAPSARTDSAIGLDWSMNFARYVLFGGRGAQGQALGDTHVLQPMSAPFTQQVGIGCGEGAWSLTTGPDLFATLPLLGSDVSITAFVPRPSFGAFVVGQEIAPVPASDCALKVVPQLVVPVPVIEQFDTLSTASLTAKIPFVPAFHGLLVPLQIVIAEPLTPGGVSYSRVLRLGLAE